MKFIIPILLLLLCGCKDEILEIPRPAPFAVLPPVLIPSSRDAYIKDVDVQKDSTMIYFQQHPPDLEFVFGGNSDAQMRNAARKWRLVYARTDSGNVFIRKDTAIAVLVPDTVVQAKVAYRYEPIKY